MLWQTCICVDGDRCKFKAICSCLTSASCCFKLLNANLGLKTRHAYLVSCSSALFFTKNRYLILVFDVGWMQKVGLAFHCRDLSWITAFLLLFTEWMCIYLVIIYSPSHLSKPKWPLFFLDEKEQLGHSTKYLLLCRTEQSWGDSVTDI